MRVHYNLVSWPAANSVRVGLLVNDPDYPSPDGSLAVERTSFAARGDVGRGENYVMDAVDPGGPFQTVPDPVDHGDLRAKQKGAVITTYYKDSTTGGKWQKIGTSPAYASRSPWDSRSGATRISSPGRSRRSSRSSERPETACDGSRLTGKIPDAIGEPRVYGRAAGSEIVTEVRHAEATDSQVGRERYDADGGAPDRRGGCHRARRERGRRCHGPGRDERLDAAGPAPADGAGRDVDQLRAGRCGLRVRR